MENDNFMNEQFLYQVKMKSIKLKVSMDDLSKNLTFWVIATTLLLTNVIIVQKKPFSPDLFLLKKKSNGIAFILAHCHFFCGKQLQKEFLLLLKNKYQF